MTRVPATNMGIRLLPTQSEARSAGSEQARPSGRVNSSQRWRAPKVRHCPNRKNGFSPVSRRRESMVLSCFSLFENGDVHLVRIREFGTLGGIG
jgi:hypothetical protein